MGAIDDVRKVMQDVVAPDLKALAVKIEALEKKTDLRFVALEEKVDLRFGALEEKVDIRFGALEEKVDQRIGALEEKLTLFRDLILAEMKAMHTSLSSEMERLTHAIDLDRRVEKLETERSATPRSPLEKRRLGLHRP